MAPWSRTAFTGEEARALQRAERAEQREVAAEGPHHAASP